jgi:hypothetical protein
MVYFEGFGGISFGNIEYLFDQIVGGSQGSFDYPHPNPVGGESQSATGLFYNTAFGQCAALHNGFVNHQSTSSVFKWGMWIKPMATIVLPWTINTVAASLLDVSDQPSLRLAVTSDLKLQLLSGGVDVWATGGGGLVWESPANFLTFGQWKHVCIEANQLSLETKIYIDGTLHVTVNATINHSGTPGVSRVSVLQLQNFGFLGVNIADTYLVDPSVPNYSSLVVGRVSTHLVAGIDAADVSVGGWSRSWSAPFLVSQNPPAILGSLRARPGSSWGLTYPDEATAYVFSGSAQEFLAGLPVCQPAGPVVALNVRAILKSFSPGETARAVVRNEVTTVRKFSPTQSMNPANTYNRLDFCFPNDPFKGTAWDESDFLNTALPYSFGLEMTAGVRVLGFLVSRLHIGVSRPPLSYVSNNRVGY